MTVQDCAVYMLFQTLRLAEINKGGGIVRGNETWGMPISGGWGEEKQPGKDTEKSS